ncbi:sigma-54 interaction domain-containing protein [Oceanobacillus halotolerans]|uniref:sigma-54 interaction domain-containing protein n=1 Tax=Oceanobacillus halotolerans TaxID=2663380 RepID=UPI0013D9C638|nr:sigma 54-interacting transcriptional regulator [Oceanobacillus halotolerans]
MSIKASSIETKALVDFLKGEKIEEVSKKYDLDLFEINNIIGSFNAMFQNGKEAVSDEIRNHSYKLKQQIEEFQAAIDSSYDGIWITDGEGYTLFVNKAVERITGLSTDDVIGKNMRELVDKGVFNISATLEAMKEKKTVTVMQKVNTGIETIVTGNLSFDENGQIFRIISNVRDITELNYLREQIKHIEEKNQKYHIELNNLKLKLEELNNVVFKSEEMSTVIDQALRLAKFDTTVLLMGETGVGKEVIAELIHESSTRKETGSFIRINCTALPDSLLESELFGYEGGAFTGANPKGKAGLFELADEGTIFLDEIGELPLHIQVKLLRVLQERNVLRVGGSKPININTRVIVATNRNLSEMVREGSFREDLYYRLNVVPITIPPLRKRTDDIPILIKHFIKVVNKKYNISKHFSSDVMKSLINYSWPGNVRELKNIVERLIVTTESATIKVEDLPEHIHKASVTIKGNSLKEILESTEKEIIKSTLKQYKSTYKAAASLGISQSTMSRKARKYGCKTHD